MARVPLLNRQDLPESDRDIFDRLEADRHVPVGNIFRALAHAPNLLRRFVSLGGHLRNRTELDPVLRELAILTVGQLTEAKYEFVHHWNLARQVGVSGEKLKALARYEDATVFEDRERAVMRYAAEVTSKVRVSDAVFDELRTFLDDRRILDLVMNVAFYNLVVRVLEPLEVELEPGIGTD